MLLVVPSGDLVGTHTEARPLAAKPDLLVEPMLFENLHVLALLLVPPSLTWPAVRFKTQLNFIKGP